MPVYVNILRFRVARGMYSASMGIYVLCGDIVRVCVCVWSV
jgi:hypothetical protein